MSDRALSSSAINLLLQALPVSSADQLLAALCDVWTQETGATSLFVSLVIDGRLNGRFSSSDDSSDSVEISGRLESPVDDWSSARALNAAAKLSGGEGQFQSDLLRTIAVVEFEFEQRMIGGVLCFDRASDDQFSTELIEVSARLIAQLRSQGCRVSAHDLQRQKLEAMAEFAAGAGHEINNPIATIAGRASLLLRSEADPERRRALETIGGQAYRVRDMIGDAMTIARPPAPVPTRFAGANVVRDVLDRFTRQIEASDIEVSVKLDDALEVFADHQQFAVVVAALIRNGIEAIERREVPGPGEANIDRPDARGRCGSSGSESTAVSLTQRSCRFRTTEPA